MRYVFRSRGTRLPFCLILAASVVGGMGVPSARAANDVDPNAKGRNLAAEVVFAEGAASVRTDDKKTNLPNESRALRPGDRLYPLDVISTGSNGKVKLLLQDRSIVDIGPSALFKIEHFEGKKGDTDRQVEVSVPYGTMRAAISQKLSGKGKFQVRTPSATMGVRGTEFVVKSELKDPSQVSMASQQHALAAMEAGGGSTANLATKTEITVLQGKVDVARQNIDAAHGMDANSTRLPSSLSGSGSPSIVSLTAGTQLNASSQPEAQAAKPVTVNAQQMSAISSQTKLADNTFTKNVTLDNAGNTTAQASNSAPQQQQQQSTNREPGSAKDGAAAPAAAPQGGGVHDTIAAAVPLPPPPPILPNQIGIPGALAPHDILTQQPVNNLGMSRKLRVVIVKP